MSHAPYYAPYYVNVAGATICQQCTDAAGKVVLWIDAHPDNTEGGLIDGSVLKILL